MASPDSNESLDRIERILAETAKNQQEFAKSRQYFQPLSEQERAKRQQDLAERKRQDEEAHKRRMEASAAVGQNLQELLRLSQLQNERLKRPKPNEPSGK